MLEIQEVGSVGVLRMEHGKANALDVEFCEALVKLLGEAGQSNIRALVITGQGGIFSAGVDLLRVLEGGSGYVHRFLPALSIAFESLFCFPKPVLAAINGHAIAGGCVLACAADYRVMAMQSGRIGIPELLVGVPFPAIALEIMRQAVAPTHFRSLVYGGATLSPEQAREHGLVDAIAEPEQLLSQAVAMAEKFAMVRPEVWATTKRQIRHPVMTRVAEGVHEFDAGIQELWESPATLAAIREYVARTLRKS